MLGPTGSTWALERSEQRHAQGGAPSQEPVGTDPKTGFRQVFPLHFNSAGIFVLFSAVRGSMSEIVVLPGHRLRGVGEFDSEARPVALSGSLPQAPGGNFFENQAIH